MKTEIFQILKEMVVAALVDMMAGKVNHGDGEATGVGIEAQQEVKVTGMVVGMKAMDIMAEAGTGEDGIPTGEGTLVGGINQVRNLF